MMEARKSQREEAKRMQGHASALEPTAKTIWRKSSSFKAARLLSDKEIQEELPIRNDVVKACVKIVRDAHGPNSNSKYRWRSLASTLGNVTEREERAAKAPNGTHWETFTEMLIIDNWFHIRKFIAALRYLLDDENKQAKPHFDNLEEQLRRVLAAVQGGYHDPPVHLRTAVCVDGLRTPPPQSRRPARGLQGEGSVLRGNS
ncbi:hypothetical protein BST61_g11418 [Cercospora zeina]